MSKKYFGEAGLIEIINLNNDSTGLPHFENKHIQFVHYPDCQQIQIWLPEYYDKYEKIIIAHMQTQNIIYSKMVSDVVSGSVKIVIDSLFIPVGEYCIQIISNQILVHSISIRKLNEGESFPEHTDDIIENDAKEITPIVYRDGFGNVIKYDNDNWREMYW
jgi:hypothetical protein